MRLLFQCSLLLLGALFAASFARADNPDGADWESLFNNLPQTESVEASFEEWRYSLLRDRPSYLKGVLRFDRELGVSLNYDAPSNRTIIIKGQSVELRDEEGETRTLPDSERYNWIPDLIGTIFSFNIEAWQGGFILKEYVFEEGEWKAVIEPREGRGRERIREVTMIGDDVYVTEMEMLMKGGKRVKIAVASAKKDIAFGDEIQSRYF